MIADIFYPIFTLTITILVCFIFKKIIHRLYSHAFTRASHWTPWGGLIDFTSPKTDATIFFLYYPLHVYHKWWPYRVWFVICGYILSFWTISCPLPTPTALNVYLKWRSYDVCFLRYGAQQTEFLSFWGTCCPLTPMTTQKIKILKKMRKKKHLMIL